VEINTTPLLCRTLCKYCYGLLLSVSVVAVVMWKLTLKIYCARLYVNTATVCCRVNCCSGGYVEINTKYFLCQTLCKYCYRVLLRDLLWRW